MHRAPAEARRSSRSAAAPVASEGALVSSSLAARRCQRAVPVLPTEVVRGRRFTATRRARLGLLVGSTSVSRLPATPGDVALEIDRGVEVPVDDQTALLAGEGACSQGHLGFDRLAG